MSLYLLAISPWTAHNLYQLYISTSGSIELGQVSGYDSERSAVFTTEHFEVSIYVRLTCMWSASREFDLFPPFNQEHLLSIFSLCSELPMNSIKLTFTIKKGSKITRYWYPWWSRIHTCAEVYDTCKLALGFGSSVTRFMEKWKGWQHEQIAWQLVLETCKREIIIIVIQ